MKKILLAIILVLALTVPALAEVHYVTPTGATTRTGESWAKAFSTADFNNPAKWSTAVNTVDQKIGPGDTVYFSGTFTSAGTTVLVPQGSGTAAARIVLDGYEAGNNNIALSTGLGAKVTILDNPNYFNFYLVGKSYIDIVDFEVEGGYTGIFIDAQSNYNRVKRCIIHDILDDGIWIRNSHNTIIGGALGDGNHVLDAGCGTGSADVTTLGATYVVVSYNWLEGGPRNDRGIDGVTLNETTHHVLIEYNRIENHDDATPNAPTQNRNGDWYDPVNHTALGTAYAGTAEDAIDIKKNCHDIVIRGNLLQGPAHVLGVNLHLNPYNLYIYCNYIYNNKAGLEIYGYVSTTSDPPPHNIHVWSNIFEANSETGVWINQNPAGSSIPLQPYQIYFYNNVFYNNAGAPGTGGYRSYETGIYWSPGDYTGSQNLKSMNNVFQQNRPNATEGLYQQEAFDTNTAAAFNVDTSNINDFNIYYHSGSTACIQWAASAYTITQAKDSITRVGGLFDNSVFGSPGMASVAAHQFWPANANSLIVGSGSRPSDTTLPGRIYFQQDNSVYVDVTTYAIGLDRTTDWTALIPYVVTRNFNASAWDKGAFPYSEGAPPAGSLMQKIRNYLNQQHL